MDEGQRPGGAEIISFWNHARERNLLTVEDRMHVLRWQSTAAPKMGVRLAIHERRDDDAPEIGDFISIYPDNGRWAVFGAARTGQTISVWRSGSGRNLGRFPTMLEALDAVGEDAQVRRRG